jgi:hypothetical protein
MDRVYSSVAYNLLEMIILNVNGIDTVIIRVNNQWSSELPGLHIRRNAWNFLSMI